MGANVQAGITIDELAALTGTTSRRIRSFQTLGLLPHPELRGRTGLYGPDHRARVAAIVRLQDRGFSLESLGELFRALEEGRSLADVLGITGTPRADGDGRGRHGRAVRLRRAPTSRGADASGAGPSPALRRPHDGVGRERGVLAEASDL